MNLIKRSSSIFTANKRLQQANDLQLQAWWKELRGALIQDHISDSTYIAALEIAHDEVSMSKNY